VTIGRGAVWRAARNRDRWSVVSGIRKPWGPA
jgi:hypothetical protein